MGGDLFLLPISQKEHTKLYLTQQSDDGQNMFISLFLKKKRQV